MGFSSYPLFIISLLLLPMITILVFLVPDTIAADYTTLVFKGCAAQKFQDPSAIYSRNLNKLFETLLSQSSQENFFTTTTGDGQNAIMGLYQCRGDLSSAVCKDCVSKVTDKVGELCGQAIAARVQFNGCYLRYEVAGFEQVPGTKFLYRVCGSTQASGAGFGEKRDAAFETVVNGVKNSKALFYAGNYQSLFVLGQCEGDLSGGDCGDCVKSAAESTKTNCGNSISGQVYLNKCYISYSYYPNGVPNMSSTSGTGTKQHTQRTVAIAVGGVAALGFVIVCLLFLKSILKKQRDY